MKRALGFTLIELLIVVAIIAILAAIAVPNFLEAQIRSKVSRAKSDMRALTNAMEAYYVDHNTYFIRSQTDQANLTSPIAYIAGIPSDPFGDSMSPSGAYDAADSYTYIFETGRADGGTRAQGRYPQNCFFMESQGPNNIDNSTTIDGFALAANGFPWLTIGDGERAVAAILSLVYDPTNGTKSSGQIQRAGGVPSSTRSYQTWYQAVSQ